MSRRMFSAPFTSALSATLHGSQTTAHVHVGHADSRLFSADTTYLTRITFRYPSELNTLEFRPVSENRGEAVERSSVEVGVAVVAPSFLSYRCHPLMCQYGLKTTPTSPLQRRSYRGRQNRQSDRCHGTTRAVGVGQLRVAGGIILSGKCQTTAHRPEYRPS